LNKGVVLQTAPLFFRQYKEEKHCRKAAIKKGGGILRLRRKEKITAAKRQQKGAKKERAKVAMKKSLLERGS
jgi:hypothetical protein